MNQFPIQMIYFIIELYSQYTMERIYPGRVQQSTPNVRDFLCITLIKARQNKNLNLYICIEFSMMLLTPKFQVET